MAKINWNRKVETVCGQKLIVVKKGLVKGLDAAPEIGRKAGPNTEWGYPDDGISQNDFLPDIRNVREYW
jgi:hypothetical protein